MAQSRVAVWAFLLAAVLFLVVAFTPIVRGGSLNATFLALAVVFFVLGIGVARKNRRPESRPPAA
jgi:succinate-acetate transporter protein